MEEIQIVRYKKLGVIESNWQIVVNESKRRIQNQEPEQVCDVPKPLASKAPPVLNIEEPVNVWYSIMADIASIISEVMMFVISLCKPIKVK